MVRISSIAFGLRNLSHAYSYVVDSRSIYGKIRELTHASINDIRNYDAECRSFIKSLETRVGAGPELKCRTLYITTRIMKPEKMVETGVATGFTSACILAALDKNGKGHLYSIDLPIYEPRIDKDGQIDASVIPKNKLSGHVIPDNLRKRWSLILGRSDEKLPALLGKIKKIDVFLHDSEHSYDNMMFELSTSFPYLNNGGLLAVDDINYNDSFREFCSKHKLSYYSICFLGLTRKTGN